MKRFLLSLCLVPLGYAGVWLLLSHHFVWGLLVFLVCGIAGHFLTREIFSYCSEEAESTPLTWPRWAHWAVWGLVAATGLILPILRLWKAQPSWIHLDAALFLLLSLIPALRIVLRPGVKERWAQRWPMILVLLSAAVLGGYALERIPMTVHGDEGEMGCWAREILRGEGVDLFAPGRWYAIPNLFFGLGAFGMFLFGDNLFGLRMHVLCLGLCALFFAYLAAERLWGRRAACIASVILAANPYFIHLMRCGVGYTQATFFGSVVFYCFVRAYDDRKRFGAYLWIHLGGVFLGLSLLSYQANHILPPLWGLSFLFAWVVRRIDWRLFLKGILGAYTAMLLVISPLLLLGGIAHLPFRDRSQQVVIFSDGAMRHLESVYHTNGDRRIILHEQIKRGLLAPVVYPDKSLQYGGPKPILDPVAGGLLMLGVVIVCCSILHAREVFPLLWVLSLLTVGAALTIDAPFYPRIAGVVPVLALLAGRTLDRLTRLPGEIRSRLVRGVQIGAVAVVLGVIVFHNIRTYFWEYRPDRSMHYCVTAMARCISEQSPETFTYFMVPPQFYFNMGTIRLIAGDHPGMDVENPSAIISGLPSNPERPLLFIVGVQHPDAVAMIRERYPNAQVTEHRNRDGTHLFTSVLVSSATPSET